MTSLTEKKKKKKKITTGDRVVQKTEKPTRPEPDWAEPIGFLRLAVQFGLSQEIKQIGRFDFRFNRSVRFSSN